MSESVFRVTEEIRGRRELDDYPLLPGDVIVELADGTFFKHAPGLGIGGFRLTDEERTALEALEKIPPYEIVGLAEYGAGL